MAFTDEQRRNAAAIIRVGNQVGASARDIQIALAVALQESGLRNLNYGDRDSQGLFQQRPSMAWGTVEQITNPEYAAKAFFLGAGTNKGLLDYQERNAWSLTEAAQKVQRSAFPDAYAKHESAAQQLLGSLGDGTGLEGTLGSVPGYEVDTPTLGEALSDTLGNAPELQGFEDNAGSAVGQATNSAVGEFTNSAVGEFTNPAVATQTFTQPGMDTQVGGLTSDLILPNVSDYGVELDMSKAATGWRGEALDLARQFLGTPYVWGGANPSGFDCSGLIQYVYKQIGIDLPRLSADQARSGQEVSLDELRPGDLVAWNNSSRNVGADHIAIYVGDGKIIEAPRPGASVQINTIHDRGNAWGVRISG